MIENDISSVSDVRHLSDLPRQAGDVRLRAKHLALGRVELWVWTLSGHGASPRPICYALILQLRALLGIGGGLGGWPTRKARSFA
jgi:hypothetical protein